MYRCVEKLSSWTFPLFMTAMLSACGGAPADSDPQPSSTNNKPIVESSSSIAASSEQSSIATSLPTPSSSSSSALSASSSSNTYTRVSLASSSSASLTPVSGSIPAPQLRLYRLSETSITITWEHAAGDARIRSYNVYRNDQLIATIDYLKSTYADNNLSSGSLYTYTIIAADIDGNVSPAAAPLAIRTLSPFNGSSSSLSSGTSSSLANSVANSSGRSAVSSTSSTSSTSSKNNSSPSSIARSSSPSQQGLRISWSHPTKRGNGTFLELDEIAGYEIRFKQNLTSNYTYLILSGNRTTTYPTDLIPANSIIEIAVYDKNGLFSDFVAISAQTL